MEHIHDTNTEIGIGSMLRTIVAKLNDIDMRLEKLESKNSNADKSLEKYESKTSSCKTNKTDNSIEEIDFALAKCIKIHKVNGIFIAEISKTEYPFAEYTPTQQEIKRDPRSYKYNSLNLTNLREYHKGIPRKFCIQIQAPVLPSLPQGPDYYKIGNLINNIDNYFVENCGCQTKNEIYPFYIIHHDIDVRPQVLPKILKEICDMLNGVKYDRLMEIENHIVDQLDQWCWDTASNSYNVIRIDKKYKTVSEFKNIEFKQNGTKRLNLSYKKLNEYCIVQCINEGYVTLYENNDVIIYIAGLKKPISKSTRQCMILEIDECLQLFNF